MLEIEKKHYEWRLKTELPIIKINHFSFTKIGMEKTDISVELEIYPLRLDQLKELPLFKILYLLK